MIMKVCVDCGVHWHDSMSCEEFQILPVDERYPDDITLHRVDMSFATVTEQSTDKDNIVALVTHSTQSKKPSQLALIQRFLVGGGFSLSDHHTSYQSPQPPCRESSFTGNIRGRDGIGSREALYWWDFKDA
ncbi:hypothetical protein Bca52824_064932 [Brassica carinata]|uniref:Uncharacterized protein n=1 Tax=Brassica carinata TaxID=52824 RepID=A0A8X7U924_BRACI|nr:hypothetical protein Bca52824_064932 [Brassica carinata]